MHVSGAVLVGRGTGLVCLLKTVNNEVLVQQYNKIVIIATMP